MKRAIYCDSYYPYYGLAETNYAGDPVVEFSQEELDEYKETMEAFLKWQGILHDRRKI